MRAQDQLAIYNQEVAQAQKLIDRTFDASLTTHNHAVVRSDLENIYRELGERCGIIVDAISAIPPASAWSRRWPVWTRS
jgi:hypothetical protein